MFSARWGTAFVFSGGANVGAVQVGMVQRLVEAGIMPDRVFGASVGALNAAAFAGDPTPVGIFRLAALWRALSGDDVFPSNSNIRQAFRQRALHNSDGIANFVELFGMGHLQDTVIPLEVAVTSLRSRGRRWLRDGRMSTALRASAALPGLLPPVRIGNDICIDGAVTDHAPIDRAVEVGMRRIIVLEAHSGETTPAGIAAIIDRATAWLRRRDLLVPHDVDLVCIQAGPDQQLDYRDFTKTDELIDAGRRAVEAWLPRLIGEPVAQSLQETAPEEATQPRAAKTSA